MPPQSPEQKEAPKKVVRVIAFQSISSNEINKTTDLENISFVKSVWIKKNKSSNNPDQIMPIGGNIDKGEGEIEAGIRELREETHLVPVSNSVSKMTHEQSYDFQHKGKPASRVAKYVEVKLLPRRYDKPYPLNNEDDKIGNFEYLTVSELKTLFSTGKLTTENGPTDLLDSLIGEYPIKDEVIERQREAEMQKKLQVLKNLSSIHKLDKEKLETLKTYEEVENYWVNFVRENNISADEIKLALRNSNYSEYMSDIEPKYKEDKQVLVPTINLIFPLLFGANFDSTMLPILRANPQFAKLYEMSRVLYLFNEHNQTNKVATKILERKILKTKVTGESIRAYFQEEGFLSKDFDFQFTSLGKEIDKWFREMHEEAGTKKEDFSFDQKNEVQSRNFKELLKLVFEKDGDPQVRFEAQRKLVLIYMLYQSNVYATNIAENGIGDLDNLEAKLEVKTGDVNSSVRKIKVGDRSYEVIIDRRQKTDLSLLRKAIVRDSFDLSDSSPFNDIFAESLVFTNPNDFTNAQGEFEIQMVKWEKSPMPKVVFDYIQALDKNKADGERIEIQEWKGLPNEGDGFASAGTGGGGNVRLCKFYINHYTKESVKTTREVQVFLPRLVNGEPVSGEDDYDFKKLDDARYSTDRLLSAGIHRSIIELLFPVSIYGEGVKGIFGKDHRRKVAKGTNM